MCILGEYEVIHCRDALSDSLALGAVNPSGRRRVFMASVRILMPKQSFPGRMAEYRAWLDGQRCNCSWFTICDQANEVELAFEFSDPAHAGAFAERFAGRLEEAALDKLVT